MKPGMLIARLPPTGRTATPRPDARTAGPGGRGRPWQHALVELALERGYAPPDRRGDRRTGLTWGATFYTHYRDKDELLGRGRVDPAR
ncbi:hypothetical protein HBB16_18690 [Pseudonocardia sp. MCCB 268]|nr:hypothetical protein [Pseudonocardia cytotoxica]